MLGTSRRVVTRWAKTGAIPSVRVGKFYEFNPRDVILFLVKSDRKRRFDVGANKRRSVEDD